MKIDEKQKKKKRKKNPVHALRLKKKKKEKRKEKKKLLERSWAHFILMKPWGEGVGVVE